MYTHSNAYTHVSVYACQCTHMSMYTHVKCIHVKVHKIKYTHFQCKSGCPCTRVSMIHMSMYTHANVHTFQCTRTWMSMYTGANVHINHVMHVSMTTHATIYLSMLHIGVSAYKRVNINIYATYMHPNTKLDMQI